MGVEKEAGEVKNIFAGKSYRTSASGKTFGTRTTQGLESVNAKPFIKRELERHKRELDSLDNTVCIYDIKQVGRKDKCQVLTERSDKCGSPRCSFFTTERTYREKELTAMTLCRMKGIQYMSQCKPYSKKKGSY